MKIKTYVILLIIFYFYEICILYAQNVTADFLINKLNYDKINLYSEENIEKENQIGTYSKDTYFDLVNRIWIDPENNKQDSSFLSELSEFSSNIVKGSFIYPYENEYMLILHTGYIGSHAEEGGNTTFIIIFNKYFEQISKVGRQLAHTEFLDKTDIDNDGLEEIFFTCSYGMDGCSQKWIDIFSVDFNKPILSLTYFISCYEQGAKNRRFIKLESNYKTEKSSITFNSKLDYYLCIGHDENGNAINKLLKTEYKKDKYILKNKKFEHIKSKDNIDWNEEGLEF